MAWVLSTPPSSTPSDQRVALRCLACNTAQVGRSNMAKVRAACVNIRHPSSKNSCGIISRSWPQVSLSLSYDTIATSIIVQTFCRDKHALVAIKVPTNTCLSRQKNACRDKSFVATKLCLLRQIFVATNKQIFVATNKQIFVATNKQIFVATNKHNFVATNKHNFVATNKHIFVATNKHNFWGANKHNFVATNKRNFVATSLSQNFCRDKNDSCGPSRQCYCGGTVLPLAMPPRRDVTEQSDWRQSNQHKWFA